jgi:hypothetical protein
MGRNEVHFMNEHELLKRINLLEYHQKLLFKILNNQKLDFYKLIIENGISEEEVRKFFDLCDELSKKMEEQKAEGYVYFHPLFNELSTSLPSHLNVFEVIHACLTQQLFETLMLEFRKYL